MVTAELPPPLAQTANPAPVRPANSVRRTSTIDVHWPDGLDGSRRFIGRARDYLTPASGGPGVICAEAEMDAVLKDDMTIVSLSARPAPANIGELAGSRVGGQVRKMVKAQWPELIEDAAPLYLLLDDLTGSAIVSPVAKIDPEWLARMRSNMTPEQFEAFRARRTNICYGLAEGNSALSFERVGPSLARADAGDVRNPADPEGWHTFPSPDGPAFRRARWIDVRRDAETGNLIVNSAFQDSMRRDADPARGGVHEYLLGAEIDGTTQELLRLSPEPRILPYPECPGAMHNAQRLIGTRMTDIRDQVLATLRGAEGCTHLNDAMRALAEVPALAAYLDPA